MPEKVIFVSMLILQCGCEGVCCMPFTTYSVPFLSPEKLSKLGFTFVIFKSCIQHGSCWDGLWESWWLHPFLCADTSIHTHTHIHVCVCMKNSYPCMGLLQVQGFQEVQAPRFRDSRHVEVAPVTFILRELFLILSSGRGWVDPRVLVWPEGLYQDLNPQPSGL
jgi:hypothetical protein